MGHFRFTIVRLVVSYVVLFSSFVILPQTGCAEEHIFSQARLSKILNSVSVSVDGGNSSYGIQKTNSSGQDSSATDTLVVEKPTKQYKDRTNTSSLTTKKEKHGKHSILSVFFTDEKIDALKNKLIKLGENHLPRKIRPTYINAIRKAFDYSVFLVMGALIIFFILNIAFVLVTLNITVKKKNQKEKFERIYARMYEGVIMDYIFGNIPWETTLIKLKHINKRQNRRILISVLMNFKANFKGELEHFIPDIYMRLNLQQDSLRLAHSKHGYKKVMGIMELTHLHPEGARGMIDKLINDPHDYVRTEAQIAYVRLNSENPFGFFTKQERPFAKWAQLSVFHLIRINQLPVPSFAKFLSFNHINIRNFSLMMITFFQQLENVSEVIKMVECEIEETRFLAYKAINDLRLYDSRELIKQKFEKETTKNKLEILRAFRNIGDQDDFVFLEEVMKTGSISMKLEACRSIYYMGQESRERIIQQKNEEIPELELLLAHVMDPRN